MTFTALIVVLGLIAILFLFGAVRNIRRRRIARALVAVAVAALLLLIVAAALVIDADLRTYQILAGEQPAGALYFTRIGYHRFHGRFTFPSGDTSEFELRGDEWQVDARVLKWRALYGMLGFDSAYRLDRISGRYTDIDDERSLPRTVYPLSNPERFDLWTLAERYHAWLPGVDALYGSATYLPMTDGASYSISVSPSGLIARPTDQAARAAVSEWH
jgi:4-amino-4-deoxy-L-arabinose transferase-like glycosyltransferase